MRNIVFVLGAPGSGRGTQCERIAKTFGYSHFSTGDLLRAEVKSGSDLGKELDAVMKTGGLVDSTMMLKILKGAMTEGNTKPVSGKYLIDGYPRAMDQIEQFEAAICKPTVVVAFSASEKVLEERILGRGKANGRAEDNDVKVIRARYATYKAQSEAVIDHYASQGIVTTIHSERAVETVWADVQEVFRRKVVFVLGAFVETGLQRNASIAISTLRSKLHASAA